MSVNPGRDPTWQRGWAIDDQQIQGIARTPSMQGAVRTVTVRPFFSSTTTAQVKTAKLGDIIGTITVENRSGQIVSVYPQSGSNEAPGGTPLFVVPPKYWKRFPLATAGYANILISIPQDGAVNAVTIVLDSEILAYDTGALGPGE
jgi:hypothetical protein